MVCGVRGATRGAVSASAAASSAMVRRVASSAPIGSSVSAKLEGGCWVRVIRAIGRARAAADAIVGDKDAVPMSLSERDQPARQHNHAVGAEHERCHRRVCVSRRD
jgi:hypothetical protein